MNIVEILRIHAEAHPAATALIDPRRRHPISFAELERDSARAAGLLWQEGLRPLDTVLVFLPMRAELYVALLAIFRLNLVAMFVDPFAGRDHLERCCALQPPKALIASSKSHLLRFASPALRRIPKKFAVGWPVPGATSWSRRRQAEPHAVLDCALDMPALITFTSGSTGKPKAAVRAHGFLLAQHQVLQQTLASVPGDVILATLPIFVLSHLASGVASVIPDADLRFPEMVRPERVISQVEAFGVTTIVASPAFLERLADYCVRHYLALTPLKRIYCGGGPIFPRLVEQLHQIAPAAEVVVVYGSTEAEPIARIALADVQRGDFGGTSNGRGLLVGTLVEAIQLRILPDHWGRPIGPYNEAEFAALALPSGQSGEIVVQGEHVLSSYLHGEPDGEIKFRVGNSIWHRTGDAGYLDARGRLWLLGRCVARMEDSRGSLYPLAVEGAVSNHPAVRRVAFFCHLGQRILAIETRDRRADGNLVNELKQQLAWAHIDEVRALGRIPTDKRHNAKIDYPALLRLVDKTG
jgi:acyl-CoA synthetase (AMP-forming)/AMP-acid ligase II